MWPANKRETVLAFRSISKEDQVDDELHSFSAKARHDAAAEEEPNLNRQRNVQPLTFVTFSDGKNKPAHQIQREWSESSSDTRDSDSFV